MDQFRTVKAGGQYGPLPHDFTYEVRRGYTALVGPNNAGKSSLLQLIFRDLAADSEIGFGGVALILADREYVQPTTETGGRTLERWNGDLRSELHGVPLSHGASAVGPNRSEHVRVLMHGDLVAQYTAMNELLVRMGLEPFRIRAQQQVEFRDVVVAMQGSGIRGALPILAALTNPDVQLVLIDEPELSLEPRLQKVLRDVLIDESEKKVIVVATHSHLFVRRDDQIDSNQRITRDMEKSEVTVSTLTEPRELYDVVFQLLGSSTEDLFFPANYLIVEGASDQVIVAKVLQLLGAESPTIKVLAARGIDAVRDAVESVYRASVPLIVNDSPYAGRVVALIDQPRHPDSPNIQKLEQALQDRLYVLDEPTIEEYIPEDLYAQAERSKDDDRARLDAASGNWTEHAALKREISTDIAGALTDADLPTIPIVVEAARRAIAEST